MRSSVFLEIKFWILVANWFILTFGIYGTLLAKKAISRVSVLLFGLGLVVLAGVDVYLLQGLAVLARASSSLADDK
jgi:hypothetical protein